VQWLPKQESKSRIQQSNLNMGEQTPRLGAWMIDLLSYPKSPIYHPVSGGVGPFA
jgi:hypothetical protein